MCNGDSNYCKKKRCVFLADIYTCKCMFQGLEENQTISSELAPVESISALPLSR